MLHNFLTDWVETDIGGLMTVTENSCVFSGATKAYLEFGYIIPSISGDFDIWVKATLTSMSSTSDTQGIAILGDGAIAANVLPAHYASVHFMKSGASTYIIGIADEDGSDTSSAISLATAYTIHFYRRASAGKIYADIYTGSTLVESLEYTTTLTAVFTHAVCNFGYVLTGSTACTVANYDLGFDILSAYTDITVEEDSNIAVFEKPGVETGQNSQFMGVIPRRVFLSFVEKGALAAKTAFDAWKTQAKTTADYSLSVRIFNNLWINAMNCRVTGLTNASIMRGTSTDNAATILHYTVELVESPTRYS
uniref:Tail protein n=1 Tax=viral metagenome TaxID=1070528 RepID=A0A6M3IEE3_9ZZZZ